MSLNKPVYKFRDDIDIGKENMINWEDIKKQQKPLFYMECNGSKIDWEELLSNQEAFKFIIDNKNKINWNFLMTNNITLFRIFHKNQDIINSYGYSLNLSIFKLDYVKMSENNKEMHDELIKEVMKPSRIFKKIQEYPDYDYLEEMFDY